MTLPWTDDDINTRFTHAVQKYWAGRGTQAAKQRLAGVSDSGTRGEVTGGQHLNAFRDVFVEVARTIGYSDTDVHVARGICLPGYYRPTKRWDVVVVRNGRLCAVIELKSQVGSFGNNINNRTEEALGNSRDFWVAHREGALGKVRPWLGYFFFLEEALKSTRPVKLAKSDFFEPLRVFSGTSYYQRYEILCDRMVLERDYDEACLVISPRGDEGVYGSPSEARSLPRFVRSLAGHLIGCL